MELDKILFLLIDSIEMSQALSIGAFLLLLNKKKKNSLLYLGLLLIVSGFSSLSGIFEIFNVYVKSPYLEFLSINFSLLIPSLLYIYVEKTSVLKKKRISYVLLIPGIIQFFIGIVFFFLPLEKKLTIEESILYNLLVLIGILYGFTIIVLTLIKVKKHSKVLRNQYSSVDHRELKWVSQFIIFLFIFFITIIFLDFLASEFFEELIGSVFGLFMTYWIAYNGLFQQTSKNLFHKPLENDVVFETQKTSKNNFQKQDIDIEKYKQVLTKIESVMKNEELFLNPELTIIHIAEKINEHPRRISTTINKLREENFNSYINKFRVEKAKTILLSDKTKRLNIEGIGQEAGFKSNSAFYTAFKKNLKTTPLQFVKTAS
ncbi:AraC family transcriptional regulator [Aquimarina sp. Aq78]|uniref:helix-turn-helix domain-containing protein n=1 Tax=Aquimarina sp. Aq78 TaxID=1191889 RepID=UPI000D0EBDA0|nr:helix-turn-helix domain-containing protein [Aquimarina sp. Aq78]